MAKLASIDEGNPQSLALKYVDVSVQQTLRAISSVSKGEILSQDELNKTKDVNQKAREMGLGDKVITKTFELTNKAGIDATYTMQVLLITGFSLDDIRKYGEPVAKDADFSLRNIMETRSSAQYMVEQQILGMVLTRKFENDNMEKERYRKFGGKEDET